MSNRQSTSRDQISSNIESVIIFNISFPDWRKFITSGSDDIPKSKYLGLTIS